MKRISHIIVSLPASAFSGISLFSLNYLLHVLQNMQELHHCVGWATVSLLIIDL